MALQNLSRKVFFFCGGNGGQVVFKVLKKTVPTIWHIIVASDNDQFKPNHMGLVHGTQAAQVVVTVLVVLSFVGLDVRQEQTNFNNLYACGHGGGARTV
ncbi:hypothetical protein [Hydromonas duriensis]|uniref:hypothetical protein n=1 Tax=Hydromonas duriensis TaxID=1527608 RepID=UPI001061887C|nr:hypothetical protein [Hydromonas duriensis]